MLARQRVLVVGRRPQGERQVAAAGERRQVGEAVEDLAKLEDTQGVLIHT